MDGCESIFIGQVPGINGVDPAYVSTLAALKALRQRPPLVEMGGYWAANDGGGGNWYWVPGATDTADDVLIVNPTNGPAGRYKRFYTDYVNARWAGAKGDSVEDPTTGAWSGTDDTNAFKLLEETCDRLTLKRYVPRGAYSIYELLTRDDTQAFQISSNVEWYGDGDSSVIVNMITGTGNNKLGMLRYTGLSDVETAVTAYLQTNATAGDQVITVNDGALFSEGMYFYLIDHSQAIIEGGSGAHVCYQGEVCRVSSIAGNDITLSGRLTFGYLAAPGDPITGTTCRRFTAPAENLMFRDMRFVGDPTLTYTNTNTLIAVRRAVNVTYAHLSAIEAGMQHWYLQDVIGYTYDSTYVECYSSDSVYTVRVGGAHFGQIKGISQFGGRHATDAGPSTSSGIEASYCRITGQAHFFNLTPWQTHPGARNWEWVSCIASTGDIAGATGSAGFTPRGRFCSVIEPQVTGHPMGVYFAFGQNNSLHGGQFYSVRDGIRINNNNGVVVSGNPVIYSASGSAVKIDPLITTTQNVDIRGVTVYGNPTAVVEINGTIDPTWRIAGIYAPDATTDFTGTPTADMTLNAVSATLSPTISGDVNDYGPSGTYMCSVLSINGGAANRNVTGIISGARGRTLTVRNNGSTNNIVLKNQDAGSTAANRFALPGGTDITLAPLESVSLSYDAASSRWLKG